MLEDDISVKRSTKNLVVRLVEYAFSLNEIHFDNIKKEVILDRTDKIINTLGIIELNLSYCKMALRSINEFKESELIATLRLN